ncbi:hypothetical protein J6590_074475 [Homalodisca vitripennis]|nr:hypothetical protein J6590_074475 [Homalodisca vitripennis]
MESHGKGAVDGIGGMVKRIVWRAVKGRKVFVNTPEDFYRVALEKCKEIRLLFVSKEEIDHNRKHLEERWGKIHQITGIQAMHHFQAYSDHEILISRTSKSLMLKVDIKNEEYDATKLSTRRRLHYEDAFSDESDDDKYESTGKDDAQMETDEEPIIKH